VRDVALPGLTRLRPALAPGPVDVWAADLEAAPPREPEAWLSADERARAARYRQPRDRQRFERRRGWLRQVLGAYLGLPPADVRLQYGPHGQPTVAGGLHFSLSQADGRVLCALSAGRRIGVDLACARPGRADDALARALFAPGEVAGLRALPAEAREPAFHRCWTRKEAYVKARGEGLALPLDAFEVSLAPEPWTTLVRCTFDPDEPARWAFLLLEPFAGYVGSVAIEAAAA
jgi:4'-phosphopantetheinyl transferase